MIIGISGKRGSGKNTIARMLQSIFKRRLTDYKHDEAHPDPFQELAFADQVKIMMESMTGYPGWTQEDKAVYMPEFQMTVGEGLQRFGTGLRDTFHKEVWVVATLKKAVSDTIITDVRFPNEVLAIHQAGGVMLRIEGNPVSMQGDGTRDDSHISETALDDYPFEYVIKNDGTLEELFNKVLHFTNIVWPTT